MFGYSVLVRGPTTHWTDDLDRAAPDYIAVFVLEAIRNRQLYLFPMQSHFKDAVRERLRLIEAALNASPATGT